MKLPANILDAHEAGRIPNGVSLKYLAQSRDHSALVGIVLMACLTGIVFILRLYTRISLIKKAGLDDWLAILTWTIYISFVSLSIILINMGSGRHIEYIQYVLSTAVVYQTEVIDFAAHILYTTALFLCRLSGFAFYHRLTARTSRLHRSIPYAVSFLFAIYLLQLFLLIFHCNPVTSLWRYAWQLGVENYKCLSWGLVYSVNSGLSLPCDVMMFAIPTLLIKQLQISSDRKVKLSFMLFPGVFVIVISAVRVWLVVKGEWATDGSWAYNPMLCVENAELAGTLIALSVPAVKPTFETMSVLMNNRCSRQTG
ncbi:uncharacterized protein N7503_009374 [Penicillium pulvis]|uniref:uncharacterized protein n=1 Tax=Penicillium pulvis TaxID=1562058 RepID=UPI0025489909|nr:uncharacterized protein N7503_009374 [Penicillium pulvis]KAJ5793396.1 hypothetical protein N7503_009374 [Penicillium pulvis]